MPCAAAWTQYFEARRAAADAALERWLPRKGDCPAPLAAAMRYAVFPGGKRLRPLLAQLACEACGGSADAALPGACAVELVHCYSLVHDDLPAMDDDDLRRGRPTCHKAFGEAVAILAGDALLTLAFEILAAQCGTPELAAQSCRELALAAGARGMVGGQADDLAGGSGVAGAHGPIERLESIHGRKTGALLHASLRLGAAAAAAAAAALEAIDAFGQKIGLAFQIADDLLDVRGSESETGKRVGKDRGHGKLTYPAVLGADASAQAAQQLCQDACAALAPLGTRGDGLRELARLIVERDR